MIPTQAIQPLRERLRDLRAELKELQEDCAGIDYGHATDRGRLARSIAETENLIKRLESQNARHP